MFTKSLALRICASLASLLVATTASPAASVPASTPLEASFVTLEHDYVVYFMSRFPVVATYLGGSAFDSSLVHIDGQLRDFSVAAIVAEDGRFTGFRRQFAALDPAALSAARRIDRTVALAQIDFLLHQHQVLRHQLRALDSYIDEPFRGVDWQIQGMTPDGSQVGTVSEWRDVIARTRAIPHYLTIARERLAAGVTADIRPDRRVLEQFGLKSTQADAQYFAKTLPELARTNVAGPEARQILADLGTASQEASAAYTGLRQFVVQTFFDPADKAGLKIKPQFLADRFALGQEAYDWALRNNLRLDTTAADLYEKSWPIVEATRARMVELAQQIAKAHDWNVPTGDAGVRGVLAELGKSGPSSDAAMLAAYRATGVRLVEYARRTKLFAVPEDYQLDVMFTPPPLRASLDGAAYYPAPPFKRAGIGRFYVTPTGDDPALLAQQHNLAALPDLAAHEGFPGHDWHYKTMTHYRDTISPIRWLTPGAVEDSSAMWEDSLAAEGWGLYAEGLIAEPQPAAPQGFYTPEEHLFQLQGLLYRDLRVRLDTGLHTGRLSFDAAVTLFSEVVDFQPGSCRAAAARSSVAKRASCGAARDAIERYARWPTQAVTYRVGKDQIMELREKAATALGSRFSLQRFHIEFMKQGTIPANYFADELLRSLSAADVGSP